MSKGALRRGRAKMRPRSRLIRLIGEELISDEPVAVVELVKNAYDADASRVLVRFEGKKPERPDELVVEDDGHGMDLETVLGAWFEPATALKRETNHSPDGRLLQGAKGIGRFAAGRLAKSLRLESKKGEKPGVVVNLDWGLFHDESYLEDVSIEYEEKLVTLSEETGTRLTLGGLCKVWNDEDYDELHARLSRLISPFKDVTGFKIDLQIPARPELSGVVQPPELILKPRYLLKGKVNAEGLFTGTIQIVGAKARPFKNQKLAEAGVVPACGPFEVEIRGWDRDREGLSPLVQELHQGVQEIRRTLDIYCGVSIYRDGFRVYPYGQKGNDWLNLDLRSRLNPVKNLANNQIVAAVRISREHNPDLKDRSTREGMILNAQHAALEDWFKMVLSLVEEERYRSRKRSDTGEGPPEPLFEPFDIKPAVQQARKELGSDHPIAVLFSDTEKQVKAGVERVQEVFSRLLMHAGLGHMVDIVIHEIGAPLGKVNRQLVLLERETKKGLSDVAWASVEPMFQSIKGWLEQIHALRQRLDPQTPAKRGRATAFDVKEELEDAFELYRALLEKQGIEWKILSPKTPVRVKMARSALGQVIVNLLDNSIYWVTKEKGAGKGGQIVVRLESLTGGFRILFSDDGSGVAEEDHARIFEPYFTRKPNGIGLGLYIARLVIEPYGKLVYNPEGEFSGACFEAAFERGVGK